MIQKYLSIILIILYGCKPIEPVNFIEIKDAKINSSKNNELFISAQIILENPNKVKITINKVDVDIYVENTVIVSIEDDKPRELIESSESTIDIEGEVNLKNLEDFLNKKGLAIILGNDDVSLKFIGKIEAKAYGIKDEIDINYTIESVKGLIK
jgi:LEA14-like dessication related protein|tara:strand:- start:22 stop:483 length:462 start_codon:yes stop_codon:yes gene_type:complete